ncbi:hypothetical protein [Bosea sp. (in: a-proteobacteria)]|uniref:hypothetical protein n=1 Tax=Bosea sp. (in: a-proteobacteria) TaxID=1871050 RepID=UPI0040332FCD
MLYLVTLATIPLTIMYAIMGLLFAPIIVPVCNIIKHLSIVLFFPLVCESRPPGYCTTAWQSSRASGAGLWPRATAAVPPY